MTLPFKEYVLSFGAVGFFCRGGPESAPKVGTWPRAEFRKLLCGRRLQFSRLWLAEDF